MSLGEPASDIRWRPYLHAAQSGLDIDLFPAPSCDCPPILADYYSELETQYPEIPKGLFGLMTFGMEISCIRELVIKEDRNGFMHTCSYYYDNLCEHLNEEEFPDYTPRLIERLGNLLDLALKDFQKFYPEEYDYYYADYFLDAGPLGELEIEPLPILTADEIGSHKAGKVILVLKDLIEIIGHESLVDIQLYDLSWLIAEVIKDKKWMKEEEIYDIAGLIQKKLNRKWV